MRQAEIDNYKGTKENQELQNAWMNMVMQPETMAVAQKHGIMGSITGTMVTVSYNAWVRDSELIQRLGEADAVKENALFEEMHELVKTGRETGKIPGYDLPAQCGKSCFVFLREHSVTKSFYMQWGHFTAKWAD